MPAVKLFSDYHCHPQAHRLQPYTAELLEPWSKSARAKGLTDLAVTDHDRYHAGVEWKFWPGPAECTGGAGGVSAADLTALLNGAKAKMPDCDKPAWIFFGLSMAGWNTLVSLGLALFSAMAASRGLWPPPEVPLPE